jgi:hypothetical protein
MKLNSANKPDAIKEIKTAARALGLRVYSDRTTVKIKPHLGDDLNGQVIVQVADLCRAKLPSTSWEVYAAKVQDERTQQIIPGVAILSLRICK